MEIYKRKPPILGRHHSEETKKKMSKTRLERKKRLGYINSTEVRKKMSEAQRRRFKNNPMSDETKRKMSAALKGKKETTPYRRT